MAQKRHLLPSLRFAGLCGALALAASGLGCVHASYANPRHGGYDAYGAYDSPRAHRARPYSHGRYGRGYYVVPEQRRHNPLARHQRRERQHLTHEQGHERETLVREQRTERRALKQAGDWDREDRKRQKEQRRDLRSEFREERRDLRHHQQHERDRH